MGKRLFNMLMKSTFYGHFVAGEDQAGIRSNVETMMKFGVKSILDYSAEEDLASSKTKEAEDVSALASSFKRPIVIADEIQFEKNTKIFIDCVDAVSGLGLFCCCCCYLNRKCFKHACFLSSFDRCDKCDGNWSHKAHESATTAAFAQVVHIRLAAQRQAGQRERSRLEDACQHEREPTRRHPQQEPTS